MNTMIKRNVFAAFVAISASGGGDALGQCATCGPGELLPVEVIVAGDAYVPQVEDPPSPPIDLPASMPAKISFPGAVAWSEDIICDEEPSGGGPYHFDMYVSKVVKVEPNAKSSFQFKVTGTGIASTSVYVVVRMPACNYTLKVNGDDIGVSPYPGTLQDVFNELPYSARYHVIEHLDGKTNLLAGFCFVAVSGSTISATIEIKGPSTEKPEFGGGGGPASPQ